MCCARKRPTVIFHAIVLSGREQTKDGAGRPARPIGRCAADLRGPDTTTARLTARVALGARFGPGVTVSRSSIENRCSRGSMRCSHSPGSRAALRKPALRALQLQRGGSPDLQRAILHRERCDYCTGDGQIQYACTQSCAPAENSSSSAAARMPARHDGAWSAARKENKGDENRQQD